MLGREMGGLAEQIGLVSGGRRFAWAIPKLRVWRPLIASKPAADQTRIQGLIDTASRIEAEFKTLTSAASVDWTIAGAKGNELTNALIPLFHEFGDVDMRGGALSPEGLTNENVTLEDHSQQATGAGASELKTADADKLNAEYDAATLADWEKRFLDAEAARRSGTAEFSAFAGRTEAQMLAAVAAGNAPRYLARVGPQSDFTKYKAFGNGSRAFIFATEPADLIGKSPIDAMLKVGWTREWIQRKVGQTITVCVLDTSKLVNNAAGAPSQMTQQEFGWPELTARALGDERFKRAFADQGQSEVEALLGASPDASALDRLVAEILDICSRTPPRGTPRTSDKHKATLALVMRLNLEAQYGANDLYSGMGATIQDNTGGLGAREVMLSQNDTKFALTDDNHKLVDLGQYTAADVEHSYSRPPSAPSSGGSK